jgi:LacI family transcriptional regulator
MAAAQRLGYTPNALGRNLSQRSTRTIGMVVTEISNPFYPNLIAPLHDELAELGYNMTLFTESASHSFDTLFDRGIDGAVLTTSTLDGTVPRELLRRGLPFTFLTRTVDSIPADAVTVDNSLGASLMAARVAQFGHRHIGAIFGPADTSTGRDRERGFRAGLAAAGGELDDTNVEYGPYTVDAGRGAMERILELPTPPTAVVCFNDLVAIGALNAARAAGVRVPEDISNSGWDDQTMA